MNRNDSLSRFPAAFTLAVLLFFALIGPTVLLNGCLTGRGQLTPSTGVYDTNVVGSTLVVTVENVREIALDAFDNFGRIERAHSRKLMEIDPKIHQAAENVRRNGKRYLDAMTNAKVAFQNSRTESNATALQNALATVQSLLKDTLKYLTAIADMKGSYD